jgi:hypothetical protein
MTSQEIEQWAHSNPNDAKVLGARLIRFAKDKDGLRAQASLGKFQDEATEWAIQNPHLAKLLILKMIRQIKS